MQSLTVYSEMNTVLYMKVYLVIAAIVAVATSAVAIYYFDGDIPKYSVKNELEVLSYITVVLSSIAVVVGCILWFK